MKDERTMKQLLRDLEILYMAEWKHKNEIARITNEINQIKLQLLTNLNLNK